MNYNYKGSLAERFIQFKSGITAVTDNVTDLFNAISVYVPSTLATANVADVVLTTIATTPIVKEVTLVNYKTVLKGDLLAQYSHIFNDDTNVDVILYIIIFHVPASPEVEVFEDFLTVTATTIDYAPLTVAFNKLYSLSFFKTMFSPSYTGATGTYDDQNYFDMALSLAYLCKLDTELSYCLLSINVDLPLATPDTNICKILSKTRAQEIAAATALNVVISGTTHPRRDYFWGMLYVMQALNTWLVANSSEVNLFPFIFGKWFGAKNISGTYIGNKLEKIRLSNGLVKPMGVPSWLNSEANENMDIALATILDDKFVGYLISIADGTINDSMIVRAKSVLGTPVNATNMAKWVDYTTSQAIAKMLAASGTLTSPVLRNERTYGQIQEMLLNNLQLFAKLGRLDSIYLNFPAYTELPASATDITVTQGWEAYYVADLEKVLVTGSVTV